jgi:hypothetical protein
MSDFTVVKKYLREIIALKPKIFEGLKNGQITSKTTVSLLKILVPDIFEKLIEYPKGKSISKEGMPRIIVLSVYIIDELISYLNPLQFNQYIEFRLKAFILLVEHDKDPEAGEIYNNLSEVINKLSPNSLLWQKLKQQVKNYKRIIVRKIKSLEVRKQFDKANLINSIYSIVPDYAYEPRIEVKEKKHFEWHFLEPLYKVIIDALFILFVFGLNLRLLKHYENGNMFTYLAKGNFDIYDLLFGLVLIFLIFWLFKVFDRQIINNLWKNIVKGLTFLFALILINVLIFQRYKNEVEKYFPDENDKKVMMGTYNDDTIRVLVTKFMPLEKTTIFNKDYSDVNASKLFYKKMLENKESSDISLRNNIIIDYSDIPLDIENEKDFKRIYKQKRYEFIIGGDIQKDGDRLCVFNSCYIVDTTKRSLLTNLKNELRYGNNTIDEIAKNTPHTSNADKMKGLIKTNAKLNISKNLTRFFSFYANPFMYYDSIFYSNLGRIDSVLCFDLRGLNNVDFDIQKDFPSGLSFISSIEKSPVITFNYIAILTKWAKLRNNQNNSLNKDRTLTNIIEHIDIIQAICSDTSFVNKIHNNIELEIHFLQLEAYFINQKIINRIIELGSKKESIKKDSKLLNLWFQKTSLMGKALELSSKYKNFRNSDIEYLQISYWFVSYYAMAKYLEGESNYNDILNLLNLQIENQFQFTIQSNRTIIEMLNEAIFKQMNNNSYDEEQNFFTQLYVSMKQQLDIYLIKPKTK